MLTEFLRLLQAVEAGRKCEGKECHEIRDESVEAAERADGLRTSHLPATQVLGHESADCPTCKEVERQEITLRESFHAQGIDLPLEVLVDLTPPLS